MLPAQVAELADVVDDSISALAQDENIFQRDGRLVHVVRVTEADADESPITGTPHIRIMALATVRERITRVARVKKFDGRSKRWAPALPSEPLVQAVIARGEYPGIRPLVGIIEAPSLRPDGSIIQSPGYDSATGYLYAPSDEFPRVPDAPTQVDARSALAELEEPFGEFPFAGPEHRATAIAAVLTVLARPAIAGSTPATIHEANTRGSGKTLKADTVSTIATGRPTAKMQYPSSDDELEKILGAYALRGALLVNFDNVTRTFGGGPLDRCLTAGDEVPAVRWRALIMATGNNVAVAGDTSRRVLISRLESPLENPEERQNFRHPNLIEWVRANRPRLVVAALTVLRAWYVAGRPAGNCKVWGSFEAWSQIVPPAIVFAGGADPMGTRPTATAEDDAEKRALVAILDGLPRLDQGARGLSAKQMIDALYPPERLRGHGGPPDGFEALRDAIDELTATQPGRPPSAQKLGNRLHRFRRRVVGGRHLECAQDTHAKVQRWMVAAGTAGTVSVPHARDDRGNFRDTDQEATRKPPQSPQGNVDVGVGK